MEHVERPADEQLAVCVRDVIGEDCKCELHLFVAPTGSNPNVKVEAHQKRDRSYCIACQCRISHLQTRKKDAHPIGESSRAGSALDVRPAAPPILLRPIAGWDPTWGSCERVWSKPPGAFALIG